MDNEPSGFSPSTISPPSYIRLNDKEREEFFSQFGITTPSGRKLVQFLCDHWEPVIYFEQFIAAFSNQLNNPRNELENLMSRLKGAKLGCLVYKKDDKGERAPHQIVLCEEASDRYWFYLVQEMSQQNLDNPRNAFLTPAVLKTYDIEIPAAFLEPFPLEQFSRKGIGMVAKIEKIYIINILEEAILVTSQNLNLFLNFASSRLRYFLKNTELVTAASRLVSMNLTEMNKKTDEKDPAFWQTLTEALLKNQEDLLADRRLHLDKGVFQAAEIFRIYLVNQVEEVRQQKQSEKERETDMKQLELLVLNDEDAIMPKEVLDDHINQLFKEKYQKELPHFKDDFYKKYVHKYQKTMVPVLVEVYGGVIHRDNFYQNFVKRFLVLQQLAQEEFLRRMMRFVRTNNRKGDLTFVDPRTLKEALSDWLSITDRFVYDIFTKPSLLTEGLIHYGKTVLNANSVDDLKGFLEQFFKPGVMTLRPLQEIFEIDAAQLYETASKKLSVFSQLWRRMTGQYDSQAQNFSAFALPKEEKKPFLGKAALTAKKPKEEQLSVENLSPEEKKKRRQEWLARKNESAKAQSSQEKKPATLPPPAVKPAYSQKDRDKAWTEFGSRLKKDDS